VSIKNFIKFILKKLCFNINLGVSFQAGLSVTIFFVCHPERLPVGRQAVEGLFHKQKRIFTAIPHAKTSAKVRQHILKRKLILNKYLFPYPLLLIT
jgi:hypothetical protein